MTLLANISNGDEESITTSTVLNNDPIGAPQRPLGIGRDIVSTPNVYQIDTTALRAITTAPTFAPLSSVLEGRLLQIGIRADW